MGNRVSSDEEQWNQVGRWYCSPQCSTCSDPPADVVLTRSVEPGQHPQVSAPEVVNDDVSGSAEAKVAEVKYEGQLQDNQRHGRGRLTRQDGSWYEGFFQNGKAHGPGKFVSAGGASYEGEWEYDQAHGEGTYVFGDGRIYEGQWCKDLKHGSGKEQWADGSTHKGHYLNGFKHGLGTYTSSSGAVVYAGQFQKDKMDGEGTYYFSNGRTYVGQWRQGQMDGQGDMTWADGSKYWGSFRKDVRHGEGTMRWRDEKTYQGQWANSQPHGEGIESNANGEKRKGRWKSGKLVQELGDELKATPSGNKQLLREYTLGKILGQGAFGVVYSCTLKGQEDFKFAVKMVDKVETPLSAIKKEAEMMKDLEHPNVVKLHGVYYEKFFVCIVMERQQGGDLIDGMKTHWKSRGQIPPRKIIHIARQITQVVQHLHLKMHVHRDVKADNFLTDRKDITDKGCLVTMIDFGTCTKLKTKEQRLTSSCGTKLYWPPEAYAGNYSFKVDVWALGVIMYGLVNGRFPFKTEQDVCKKVVRLPATAPKLLCDFVLKLLEKKEDSRLSAVEAASHPWVSDEEQDVGGDVADGVSTEEVTDVRESGANAAQNERRQELVERLEIAAERKKTFTDLRVITAAKFDVHAARTGHSTRYEWWTAERVKKDIIDVDQAAQANFLDKSLAEIDTVKRQLEEHGIDTSKFGRGEAKTLEEFAIEVQGGTAQLMLDAASHKKLVRVVNTVLVRLVADHRYLVEYEETYSDGRTRLLNRLPGTKKEPHENTKTTALKIVEKQIGIFEHIDEGSLQIKEVYEEEVESRSYPGVMTVYRKEIVEILIKDTYNIQPRYNGYVEFVHSDNNNKKKFRWLSEGECESSKIKLHGPAIGDDISGLVQAPIGFDEEELEAFLAKHNIKTSEFGKDNTKTLKEFSDELLKGEASLIVQPDGKMVRVVDVVLLFLRKRESGYILVELFEKNSNGEIKTLNRLPCSKRRPGENQFTAAQRILKRDLKMDENYATINPNSVRVIEEEHISKAYPQIRTLYRKRIIEAALDLENTWRLKM